MKISLLKSAPFFACLFLPYQAYSQGESCTTTIECAKAIVEYSKSLKQENAMIRAALSELKNELKMVREEIAETKAESDTALSNLETKISQSFVKYNDAVRLRTGKDTLLGGKWIVNGQGFETAGEKSVMLSPDKTAVNRDEKLTLWIIEKK